MTIHEINTVVDSHFTNRSEAMKVRIYCYKKMLNLLPQDVARYVRMNPADVNGIAKSVSTNSNKAFQATLNEALNTIQAEIQKNRLKQSARSNRGIANRTDFKRDIYKCKMNQL